MRIMSIFRVKNKYIKSPRLKSLRHGKTYRQKIPKPSDKGKLRYSYSTAKL